MGELKSTMHAWTIGRHAPWHLTLQDVASPRPRANEASVSVGAFSINRGEMALLERLPEGWHPGHDLAGIVLEPAADGSGPPRGARVVGLVSDGAWAERVAVPTSALAMLPASITLVQGATLPVAGLCAMRALRPVACAKGARLLVTGAAGGVGSFLVQLAARAGAAVTAVTERRTACSWLRHLGASDIVHDIADARGRFDGIIESVGGASLAGAICKVAPGGTIVLAGNSCNTPTPVSLFDFIGHEGARLVTFMNYASDACAKEELETLVGYVARGELTPQIGRIAPWEDLLDALDALQERRVLGKAVLCIASM